MNQPNEQIKELGQHRMALSRLLPVLGFKGINIEKIDYDVFSNQIIFTVSGDLDRYPESIKPIPKFTAVTGL
jgi:hypothetical protein